MNEAFDIDEHIRAWLREQVTKAGHGVKGRLAAHLGFKTQDGVTRLIAEPTDARRKGLKKFPVDLLPKIEEFFGSSPFAGLKKVSIVGLAGAGPDGSVLFATGDGNFGEVDAPIDASPATVALEVRGDSMYGVANDGWIIFYDDEEEPRPDHMGELCVCFLEDDRVLVKFPHPGSQPGLFNLESANAPTMRDIPVRSFSLVTDIKPRRSARRYATNKNGQAPVDISIGTGLPSSIAKAASLSDHEQEQIAEATQQLAEAQGERIEGPRAEPADKVRGNERQSNRGKTTR